MKPSVYSDFSHQQMTGFDRTPCGSRVMAERHDEPGDEDRALKDEFGPVDLMADLMGDWSWKPVRYSPDPGYSLSRAEIDELEATCGPILFHPPGHPLAGQAIKGQAPRLRKESPERIAQLEAQMPTFRGVPPSFAESRPRGPEPGAKFYGIPEHMKNETAEQFLYRVTAYGTV